MKRYIGVFFAGSILLSTSAIAGQTGNDYNRAGQWGLGLSAGTAVPGVGLRYWFNDKFAVDAGGALSLDTGNSDTSDTHKEWAANSQLVYAFHKRDGLRLEGLFGAIYDHNRTNTQSDTNQTSGSYIVTDNLVRTTTVGVGLAAEYSFQELPDLGFSAFATGIGAAFISRDNSVNNSNGTTTSALHESYVTLATKPSVGLAVHYYF